MRARFFSVALAIFVCGAPNAKAQAPSSRQQLDIGKKSPLSQTATMPATPHKQRHPVPGFAACEPAIFLDPLYLVTVTMTDIKYMPTNRLAGFRLVVINANGRRDTLTVKIDATKWNGNCESLVYAMEEDAGAKPSLHYASSAPSTASDMIAFSPIDPGGIVLGGGATLEGDMVTQLTETDSHRRILDTQTFQLHGRSYVITYSDYKYGPVQIEFGSTTNLLGYTASIVRK